MLWLIKLLATFLVIASSSHENVRACVPLTIFSLHVRSYKVTELIFTVDQITASTGDRKLYWYACSYTFFFVAMPTTDYCVDQMGGRMLVRGFTYLSFCCCCTHSSYNHDGQNKILTLIINDNLLHNASVKVLHFYLCMHSV